jgi:hypothetical protein
MFSVTLRNTSIRLSSASDGNIYFLYDFECTYTCISPKRLISNAIVALTKSRSLFLSREASPVQDPLPEQRDRPV